MRRLITFTVIFAAICCISCKKEKPPVVEPTPTDTIIPPPPAPKYEVGRFYNVDGVKGIIYKVDTLTKTGMIVSLDEKAPGLWSNTSGSTQARSYDKGESNMAAILALNNIAHFPAFEWCENKNKEGISGWYLPAVDELQEVAIVYNLLQDTLAAYKDVVPNTTQFIPSGDYWSSTDGADNPEYKSAYYVRFSNTPSNTTTGLKAENTMSVRAIRAFSYK